MHSLSTVIPGCDYFMCTCVGTLHGSVCDELSVLAVCILMHAGDMCSV